MRKIWEPSSLYLFLRPYVDLCTRAGFRSVTLEGTGKIPDDGALFFAPNHCAAMNDPLLVLLLRPRRPVAFGARSDIFAHPVAATFFRWLRILPIARERNGRRELERNLAAFDEAVECLAHGIPFCMFAEGTHRPQRGMMPMKKGIFKMARQASLQREGPVYIVPLGIDYEYFFRPMGRVALRVGTPVDIGAYFAQRSDCSEREIYESLCSEVRSEVLSLIGRPFPKTRCRRPIRLLAALLSLPLFLLCALLSLPLWLLALAVTAGFSDKAWTHTVHFAVRFLFFPLWPFYRGFYGLLNLYSGLR